MTIATFLNRGLFAGAALLAAGLGGCADGYYGGGYGYAAPAYYAGPVGYGADYYAGYGYPGYGWFGDFYYPGYGVYVFDRFGHRRGWNDAERQHWAYRGGYRGNHLYDGNRFDARRDRAYLADRQQAFRSLRQAGPQGRPLAVRPQGEHRRP